MQKVIEIPYGRQVNYYQLFLNILNSYKAEMFKKVRCEGNTRKYYTPNIASVGKGKSKVTYVNIGGGYDCETSKVISEEKGKSIAFPYVMQLSLKHHVILDFNCDKAEDFYIGLSEAFRTVYEGCTLLLFDCNLGYEFSFFKGYLRKIITSIFAKTKRDVLKLNICDNIVIQEVIGLFGRSLADIAKTYTTTQKLKGDLDYNKVRLPITTVKPEERQYDINDVVILSELYDYVFNTYLAKGKKIPLTKTGIVRNEVKEKAGQKLNFIKKDLLPYLVDRDLYTKLRTWLYKGGLTHSLYTSKGEKKDNVFCIDLTSAYPWTYATQYFPSGDRLNIKPCKECIIQAIKKYRHWYAEIYIQSMTSKTGHSIESIHKVRRTEKTKIVVDNGRVLQAENIVLTVNEVDYKSLVSNYKIKLAFISFSAFTKSIKCPDYIRIKVLDYFKDKTNIKVEIKKVEKRQKELVTEGGHEEELNELSILHKSLTIAYNESKEKVNSVYGCTGTEVKTDCFEIDNKTGNIIEGDSKEWNKAIKDVFLSPFLAYWCTSYVRARLIEGIVKFPDKVHQYDTDSLYVTADNEVLQWVNEVNDRIRKEAEREIPETEYEVCRQLGQWDIDGKYQYLMPLGSKRYLGCHHEEETEELFKANNTKDTKEALKFKYKDLYSNITTEVLEKVIYLDSKYKLTFAGANKTDIYMYCAYNNIDIEKFIIHMNLSAEVCTKLTPEYFDNARTAAVTDYEGNTMQITWLSGQILNNTCFTANLDNTLYKKEGLKDVKHRNA